MMSSATTLTTYFTTFSSLYTTRFGVECKKLKGMTIVTSQVISYNYKIDEIEFFFLMVESCF